MSSTSINSSSLTKKSGFDVELRPKRFQQSHSRVQRDDFLAAVARLGTVAAAARELGINRSTCQKWANAAGIRPQRSYTSAEKSQFYVVLDRTGSITEAASILTLYISTAQNWANSANQPSKSAPARRTSKPDPAQHHRAAVREEFLEVLREVGSVSVASKKLGPDRSTCSNWANEASMASISPRRPSQKQLDYLRLRLNGVSRRDAAVAVGASKQSSYVWIGNKRPKTRSLPAVTPRACRINRK